MITGIYFEKLIIAVLLLINGCVMDNTVLRVIDFFVMLYLLRYSFEFEDRNDRGDGPHTPLFG